MQKNPPHRVEPFTHQTTVRFHQADPAGVVFFGDVYRFVHEAYEEFLKSIGIEWTDWFANEKFAVPIRKSECEYFQPLAPPLTYAIAVQIDSIGESSFTMRYSVKGVEGKLVCTAVLVHMFIDKKTRTKMPVPSDIRRRFETYQSQCL